MGSSPNTSTKAGVSGVGGYGAGRFLSGLPAGGGYTPVAGPSFAPVARPMLGGGVPTAYTPIVRPPPVSADNPGGMTYGSIYVNSVQDALNKANAEITAQKILAAALAQQSALSYPNAGDSSGGS